MGDIKKVKLKGTDIGVVRKTFLSSSYLEEYLEKNPYTLPREPFSPINIYGVPPLYELFYTNLANYGCLPSSLEDFWESYFHKYYILVDDICYLNEEYRKEYSESPISFRDLKDYVFLEYPQIMRDLHLYFLCHESNFFQEVTCTMSPKIPIFSVKYKDKNFKIFLLTSTRHSLYHSIQGGDKSSLTEDVLLEIKKKQMKKVGNISLCTEDYICDILNKIDRFLVDHENK